jgi:hypothetical protein
MKWNKYPETKPEGFKRVIWCLKDDDLFEMRFYHIGYCDTGDILLKRGEEAKIGIPIAWAELEEYKD